jgi:cytochrome c-type biogenesis protein CcmH
MRWGVLLALMLCGSIGTVLAQPMGDPTPLQYRDRAEEARFHALAAELRCVQCQNQSLADSQAQIAHDLRREVLHLMQQGQSDEQIKAFLVVRYGAFVLYRPQMQAGTVLLWFGPLLLLFGGAATVVYYTHRRAARLPAAPAADTSQDEREW